ncbi:NAD(P)-dependent dehydrogenase (short-subunit alcohol dehydrogenase family) [Rathayibacter sp. PhB93]|uniref:SDR family NAD(P)-dependent oxidoreductase n=1 Tax=unclassified Rathayibacter TaxID=2609250 RepID=UPI000F4691B7|nr:MULTISPECIES: SDR family oxidoreductase [unclassified Rathayibacter]ROQ00913.1 NAD(P)-dependent dehydrogenase (short-subunit alcohol dehydrogenase family) [Rathayibacter sp. PhB93]TDQ07267.1 NAD(P)-dependent dehydrogenase (short-subunit alcohol dehydrogenase family) [Rathayibacter sp. PhB1]
MTVFPESRTVVLTGAASPRGIGRYSAHHLAELGWNVGVIDLHAEAAQEVAAEIAEQHGVQAAGAGANVADDAQVRAAFDALEAALPPVVALVNLAGIASPVSYLEVTPEEWQRVLDVNLNGVHFSTRRAVESMVTRGVGRVVSLSSVSAQRGGGTFSKTAYSAAKAGVIGFTRSVARELGGQGITVNAISPGPIDTDIMGGTLTEERKTAMAADGVLPRIGTPRDIAAAIAYLISEDAGFVTGQTLNVDGGLYMH